MICWHCNINSILAHDKLSLLTAYISSQHYHIICIFETYLDSPVDENTLNLDGYNLIRADYPGNMKRDGVCIASPWVMGGGRVQIFCVVCMLTFLTFSWEFSVREFFCSSVHSNSQKCVCYYLVMTL